MYFIHHELLLLLQFNLGLDEQIQVCIHRVSDVGCYTAEINAFDDFLFFDAMMSMDIVQATILMAIFCAWAIIIGNWPAWFGNKMSNIFPMPRLATLTFSGRFMTFRPRK